MQDSGESNRLQRRSALLARELAQLDIDIAALSEVRFAEQGSLNEHGAGYTLFWSGKGKEERRLSGVGFMIKHSITSKLQSLPVGHPDCIMSLRLPLLGERFITHFSVYAPTLAPAGLCPGSSEVRQRSITHQSCQMPTVTLTIGSSGIQSGSHSSWQSGKGSHRLTRSTFNRQLLAKRDVFKKELEAKLNNKELLGQE